MLIGNGDIATSLKAKWFETSPNYIFFASGVSNSLCDDAVEFEREKSLLLSQPKNKHLTYFSTLSIFYVDSQYTKHKLNMEGVIKENFTSYTIIRIGNITWGKNPNTFINFFRNKIKNNDKFEIFDGYRFLVNEKDLVSKINTMVQFGTKKEFNIIGEHLSVKQVVELIALNKI